jgi:hypothetical protein
MTNQITYSSANYFNNEFEAYLQKVKNELLSYCSIQGELDGKKNKPVTTEELRALILNKIQVNIQEVINVTHKTFTPVSGMVIVRAIEKKSEEKINSLNAELGDLTHKLLALQNEKKSIELQIRNVTNKYIEYGIAIIGGCIEGVFIYDALSNTGLSLGITILTSVGLAVSVAAGIHYSAGYIRKALSKDIFYRRCAIVLGSALVFFATVGFFRADYYNDTINLTPGATEIQNGAPIESGLKLGIISFIIFCVALIAAYMNWRSDEEKQIEETLRKKNQELEKVTGRIKEIKDEINSIQSETMLACALATAKFEYALATEKHLDNLAHEAFEVYKEKNLRHRNDLLCPGFFSHPPTFVFVFFFYSMGVKNNNGSAKEVEP